MKYLIAILALAGSPVLAQANYQYLNEPLPPLGGEG